MAASNAQSVIEYSLQSTPPAVPVILSPSPNATVHGTEALILGRSKSGYTVEILDGGVMAASETVTDPSGLFGIEVPLLPVPRMLSAKAVNNFGFSSKPSPSVTVSMAPFQPFDFEVPVIKHISAPPYAQIFATTTVTADFNNDGNTDIFALGTSGLVVLAGDGFGNFSPLLPIAPPNPGDFGKLARALAADLNRDGNMDVVAADIRGGLGLLRGHGDGPRSFPSLYWRGRVGR